MESQFLRQSAAERAECGPQQAVETLISPHHSAVELLSEAAGRAGSNSESHSPSAFRLSTESRALPAPLQARADKAVALVEGEVEAQLDHLAKQQF